MASAGDVNGDGIGDVAVGAPRYDAPDADELRPVYGLSCWWDGLAFRIMGIDRLQPMRAVVEGDWKLVMETNRADRELYNLKADPAETQNILAENPAVAADLAAKITDIVTTGRTTPGTPVSNDTEHWSDLTWIND